LLGGWSNHALKLCSQFRRFTSRTGEFLSDIRGQQERESVDKILRPVRRGRFLENVAQKDLVSIAENLCALDRVALRVFLVAFKAVDLVDAQD